MTHKISVIVVCAVVLSVATGWAQTTQSETASALLQKAIYTHQTSGRLDDAIKLYRQVLTSFPTEREIAMQAQYGVAQCYLQEGDLDAASREFATLAAQYSDMPEVARLIDEASAAMMRRGEVPIGELDQGRYRHFKTNTEFTVPADWSVAGGGPSSDNGEMVVFRHTESGATGQVWLIPEENSAAEIPGVLDSLLEQKPSQRTSFQNYRIRPETVHRTTVGGAQALTALAEYTANGRSMAEYLTWVVTENAHVFFFGRVPDSELAEFQANFDEIIYSSVIP